MKIIGPWEEETQLPLCVDNMIAYFPQKITQELWT